MDDYRLTGRVVHLDQFADAPGEGVRRCEFIEQLVKAVRVPGDRPVAPMRPHYGHVPFELRVRGHQ